MELAGAGEVANGDEFITVTERESSWYLCGISRRRRVPLNIKRDLIKPTGGKV